MVGESLEMGAPCWIPCYRNSIRNSVVSLFVRGEKKEKTSHGDNFIIIV